MKTYSQMMELQTFRERVLYAMTHQFVGEETLGYLRYLSQQFYKSPGWRRARRNAVLRDGGFDLGDENFPIRGMIYVHHIQPITAQMLEDDDPLLYDEDNLICCSFATHNLIHYGSEEDLDMDLERTPGDTRLW